MIANVIESVIKKNLPIGTYTGYWGGMGVVVNFDGEQWFLKTDVGVKGFNIPASVVVTSQGATVEVIHKQIHKDWGSHYAKVYE